MYKVIEIVDNTHIIINYGTAQGAREDKQVRVFSIGRSVVDPETNEDLGTWNVIKATLTITEAFRYFSICSNKEVKTSSVLEPFPSGFTRTVTKFNNINVDENQITNNKNEPAAPIQVGDFVEIL